MPDRDERGRFLVGNRVSQGNLGLSKDLYRLKREWVTFWDSDKFNEIMVELHRIALTADKIEDRLEAIEMVFSRTWGKPVAPVLLDVTTETNAPIVDLSDEEMVLVEKILNKTAPHIIDVEPVNVRAIESA